MLSLPSSSSSFTMLQHSKEGDVVAIPSSSSSRVTLHHSEEGDVVVVAFLFFFFV
jgi:hypothetical protein